MLPGLPRSLDYQSERHCSKTEPRDFSALSKTNQREVFKDSLSEHAAERMEERGVTREQMDDALAHPMHVTEVKVDEQGRKSQKYIGRSATVAMNPDTGKIVTTYKTKARFVRKYGNGDGQTDE